MFYFTAMISMDLGIHQLAQAETKEVPIRE